MSRSQALEKCIFKGMLGVMLFENTSNLSGTVMPLYQAHFSAMEWKRNLAESRHDDGAGILLEMR
jgi:hypothetical protein